MSEDKGPKRRGKTDSASQETNPRTRSGPDNGQHNKRYVARSVDKDGAINTIDIIGFWEYSV